MSESATTAVSMAIDRPQAIDAAPLGAGAKRRMAAAGLSWLARNGRSPGEESLTAAIAVRRSRLAVLWPDHAIKRPRGPRARQPCKEKTWRTWVRARGQASRAKEQKPWRTERRPSGTSASARFQTPKSISCGYRSRFDRSAAMAALSTVGFDDPHPPHTPTEDMNKLGSQLSLAAGAAGNSGLPRAPSPDPISGGFRSARRPHAVAPTATAPKSANACCHGSAGTPSCARPRAA